MRDQPEQQAPPVQKLRIRYAKRARMRFASHRDFSRAFERALVRAQLPMAYSSGFNPHPRISYSGAAPTGAASEAEFLEIGLAHYLEPADVLAQLAAVMPPDLVLVAARTAEAGSLADGLLASDWEVSLNESPAEIRHAIETFLAAEEAPTQRMTKRGMRDFDTRGSVELLAPVDGGLRMVLHHQTPSVRPDDVLRAMATLVGAEWVREPLLTRVSQGEWDAEQRVVVAPF